MKIGEVPHVTPPSPKFSGVWPNQRKYIVKPARESVRRKLRQDFKGNSCVTPQSPQPAGPAPPTIIIRAVYGWRQNPENKTLNVVPLLSVTKVHAGNVIITARDIGDSDHADQSFRTAPRSTNNALMPPLIYSCLQNARQLQWGLQIIDLCPIPDNKPQEWKYNPLTVTRMCFTEMVHF